METSARLEWVLTEGGEFCGNTFEPFVEDGKLDGFGYGTEFGRSNKDLRLHWHECQHKIQKLRYFFIFLS